jgi:hypothetical protein
MKEVSARTGRLAKKHGHSGSMKSATYTSWARMKQRCTNPNATQWKYYGGRGITVSEKWRESFSAFLSDMGARPQNMTLDRIDSDGDYTPDNCRWATRKDQCNNRRTNRLITYNGETLTLTQWSDRTGIRVGTIWARINKNWPAHKALTLKP